MCENKHKHPRKKWDNLPFIVTSNMLPHILTEKARDSSNENDKADYAAFQNRIKFYELTYSYISGTDFPYEVEDLA